MLVSQKIQKYLLYWSNMTAEEALFRIEEKAYAVLKRQVRDNECTTIEELAIKKAAEIQKICNNYKELN